MFVFVSLRVCVCVCVSVHVFVHTQKVALLLLRCLPAIYRLHRSDKRYSAVG
jgi:hypothetical protein